jgi:hypothetical protein
MLRELQYVWGFAYVDRVHVDAVKICAAGLVLMLTNSYFYASTIHENKPKR